MQPHSSNDDARFLYLLERWVQGDFSRADERELHALTESDAFRREAWEGFTALPETDHAGHLARLRARLRSGAGGRRIPLGMWMAAAAVLVLVVAAVYFVPQWTGEIRQPVAQTVPEQAERDVALAPVPPAPQAIQDQFKKTRPRTDRAPFALKDSQADIAVMEEESKTTAVPAPEPAKDEAQRSAAAVSVPRADSMPAIYGGPAGNANLPAPATARAKQNPVSAKPAAPPAVDQATGLALEAPAPVGGWDAFRQYIQQNARLTQDALNHNATGTVRLRFNAGKDGRPMNISVLRSVGYGCDEEAKRLVRAFAWAPAGSPEPVLVDIPFVR